MDISVIICTHNRCESLRQTLQTCCDLVIPEGVTWELLIVDNNSTDHTKQVCEEFTVKLPLRYIFEPRQGKSHALNCGVREANGPLLLFTDDDVDVTPDWMNRYHNAAGRYPQAVFFGGKILPRWEQTPPRWVVENIDWLRINVHLDMGDSELLFTKEHPQYAPGANVAFRRGVFANGLRFQDGICPTGEDNCQQGNLRGEELEVEKELLTQGMTGLYVPGATVFHRHAPHRSTETYLRRFHVSWGISEVRTEKQPLTEHIWFGAPRWYWKQLLLNACRYLIGRWMYPSRFWLTAEINMAMAWGAIIEHRRRRRKAG